MNVGAGAQASSKSGQGLDLDGINGREVADYGRPSVTGIGRAVDLASGGAEIDAALIEGVDRHGIAEDVDVAVFLRETLGEFFPFVAAGAAAVNPEFAVGNKMLAVALDRDDVDGVRLVSVDVDDEAEVGGKIAADFLPGVAGVVRAHDVPVFLHEQDARTSGIHGDVVNAVADLGVGVGDVLRVEAFVDRLPGFPAVVGAEGTSSRDGDVDTTGVFRVQDDGVKTHSASAGLPTWAGAVASQAREFVPVLSTIGGAEKSGVLDPSVDGVGISERRFKMPDALELPRMLRAVVPLVGSERRARLGGCVVDKLVAFAPGRAAGASSFPWRRARLEPRFAAVIGALDHLPEPAAGLRGVEAIGVGGRTLQVIHLPASEVRAGDIPSFAFAVRGKDECALFRANQDSNVAHDKLAPSR